MTRVLIVTHDVLGQRMAGPAIRCLELAKQLATTCEVTLTSLMPLDGELEAPFPVTSFENNAERLLPLAQAADVLVLQGLMPRRYPLLLALGKHVVMDLYDPFIFESYPAFLQEPATAAAHHMDCWDVQNEQMEIADFSLCASERQRDMWLGRYCAVGKLTPEVYAADASFRRLLDVVPFGVSDTPLRHERRVLKGVVPGIGPEDKVLLWGGGIWNWFDPLTLIRAVAQLAPTRPELKLYFLGVKHPNPEIPEMEMTARAIALATELGLRDRHVFFHHDWVPYADRQNYLAEADLGVSCHFDSIETRFSFRTRVLDYLWAGLPILSTEGDSMAELVSQRELGRVVRYESVEDWVGAIADLLDDEAGRVAMQARVRATSEEFRWSVVARPLVRYCEAPYRMPRPSWSITAEYGRAPAQWRAMRLVRKASQTLQNEGVVALGAKAAGFLRKRLAPRPGRGG